MHILFEALFNLLRDAAVGALINIIQIFISMRSENRKRRRELSYEIVSDNNTWQHGLFVRIIALKLWNSGNEIIETSHFYNPITFTFGPNAIVKNTSEEDKKPDNILLDLHTVMNKVELQPFFLKCKESFTLTFSLLNSQAISVNIRGNLELLDVAAIHAKLQTKVIPLYGAIAICGIIWIASLVLTHKYINVQILNVQIFPLLVVLSAMTMGYFIIRSLSINMRRYQLSN